MFSKKKKRTWSGARSPCRTRTSSGSSVSYQSCCIASNRPCADRRLRQKHQAKSGDLTHWISTCRIASKKESGEGRSGKSRVIACNRRPTTTVLTSHSIQTAASHAVNDASQSNGTRWWLVMKSGRFGHCIDAFIDTGRGWPTLQEN